MSFRRRPEPSKVIISEKLSITFVVFWEKIEFPGQTVEFCLYHVLHIVKAIDLTVNLGHLESFLEHPTSIFANKVGGVCKLDLTLRRTSKAKKSLRPNYSAISTSMVEWVSWVGLVLSNSGSEMMVGRLVNQRDTISHTVADCL